MLRRYETRRYAIRIGEFPQCSREHAQTDKKDFESASSSRSVGQELFVLRSFQSFM